MFESMLEFLVQSLHLSADEPALRKLLRPLSGGERPPRVLSVGGALSRPLRAAGCEVFTEETADKAEPLDAICAAVSPLALIPTLTEWSARVRPGGMVLLVTRRGRPTRARLCAGFLHAGLRDPVQRTAGVSIITAGLAPAWRRA